MKGTVIKRGRRWSVVLDAGRDADGKRIRHWHSGYTSKRAAEEARIELLAQMQRGQYIAPSSTSLSEWLDVWLANRTNLADTTREGYARDAKRVTRRIGHIQIGQLTPARLSTVYRELSESLAPATVKNTNAVIHKALSDAVTQGVLPRNPAAHVELPRAEPPVIEAWTAQELSDFLSHASAHRLYPAWVLMCSTGVRRSEVLGVRWPNLDLDTARLAVMDTVVPIRSKPVLRIGETKSRSSRRVIALDGQTVAALREHRRRQTEERLRAGEAWQNLDLVFTNELGGMINPATFTRLTKRLAVEAGVKPLTPHSAARHTWPTLALASGINPKVVQERLGHSSISITLDRYSHLVEGMDRQAAEAVAALVTPNIDLPEGASASLSRPEVRALDG